MRDWTPEERALLTNSLHQATRAIDAAMGDMIESARELGERGWTIPVEIPPVRIARLVRSVAPEDTDEVFVEMYSVNQSQGFEVLAEDILKNTELERWKPLVAQSISAYRRDEFLIVVPALLSAYEGALAAVVDRPNDTRPPTLANNELNEAETNLERVAWTSIVAFTNTVFKSSTFAGDRPNLLNRHWVLHGRDSPTWSRADCLRLFQALHTLGVARLRKRRDLYQLISDPKLREAMRNLELLG
jgi:hypothetical protein